MLSLFVEVSCDKCTQRSTYILYSDIFDELQKQGWEINKKTGAVCCPICRWEENHKINPPTRKIRADLMSYQDRLKHSKKLMNAINDISLSKGL